MNAIDTHETNVPVRPPARRRPLTRFLLLVSLVLLLFLLSAVYIYTTTSQSETLAYDPGIADIISQVTPQTLEHEAAGLTGERPIVVAGYLYTVTTRESYDPVASARVTQYAYEQFASTGLNVTYQNFDWTVGQALGQRAGPRWRAFSSRNVIAEKPGQVDPQRIYLLTAHIDDMPIGPRAPGADDNASGSAAVLTAARLLAPRRFAYTIRFVLFAAEEQGLFGSAAYAAECAAQEQDIRGVINLDMIAYNSDAEWIVALYASRNVPQSVSLTGGFATVIDIYDLKLLPERSDDPQGVIHQSDSGSFIGWGYPAMLVSEDWDDHTPYYHTASDRLSTLDLNYYTSVTRAAIATIAHLATPLD